MARKLYSTRTGQMDLNGLLSQGEPLQRHLIRKRKSRLDKGSGTERPKHNITLGEFGVEEVRVRRLTRDSGTAQHTISWAGQRWSHESKAFQCRWGMIRRFMMRKIGRLM